jgi:Uma2 family endonuclease
MASIESSTPMYIAVHTPQTSLTLDEFRDWVRSDSFPQNGKISYIQGRLFIETNRHQQLVEVPHSGMTLEEFRSWVNSEDYPQRGRITYVKGKLIIDMSPERIDSHNKIKTEIVQVMARLVQSERLGEFYSDRAWIIHRGAGVSNEPDAAFAAWETLKSGKLAPTVERPDDDRFELVGAPDWVCEIVSDSSEKTDTRTLVKAYHKAGIAEYWLIDAREEEIEFQILVWRKARYVPVEPQDDWHASPLFQREFQLVRRRNEIGRWDYELLHRRSSTS